MKRSLIAFLIFASVAVAFVWWASTIVLVPPACDAASDSAAINCQ